MIEFTLRLIALIAALLAAQPQPHHIPDLPTPTTIPPRTTPILSPWHPPWTDQHVTQLVLCESGGNWQTNTGNGYYGGLQFDPTSWAMVGGTGLPHQATPAEQVARGKTLWDLQGWLAWPGCSCHYGWISEFRGQPCPAFWEQQ